MHTLQKQYELVKESREVVFEFCEHFSPQDYVKNIELFGNKSIRFLQTHIANCYLVWLNEFARQKEAFRFDPEKINTVNDMKEAYKTVNACVAEFIVAFQDGLEAPVENKLPGREKRFKTTPLELLTHVMSHEFHHKGQILSMARILGYTPIDTDVIRT